MTAGVSVFRRGRILTYGTQDGLPGGAVTAIARDSGGTMWAATSRGLARLVGGRWESIDTAAGYPGGYTEPVLVDGSGSVWAVAEDGIYILARGAARFEKRKSTGAGHRDGELDLVAAPDGSVWAAHRSYGVFPVGDARGGTPPSRTLAYPDTGIYVLELVPRQSRGGRRNHGAARTSVALLGGVGPRPPQGRSPSLSPALRA